METFLKENGFEEQDGQWWWFKRYKPNLIVFLEEDNSWTGYLSESIDGWDDEKNLLFSCLPEDQAKITIARLTNM